jgi:hypothetical protein
VGKWETRSVFQGGIIAVFSTAAGGGELRRGEVVERRVDPPTSESAFWSTRHSALSAVKLATDYLLDVLGCEAGAPDFLGCLVPDNAPASGWWRWMQGLKACSS